MTDWADMDFDERSRMLYEAARNDRLAKQIASDASTTSATILAFGRANGIPVRTRVPGLHRVKLRKSKPKFSTLSTRRATEPIGRVLDAQKELGRKHEQVQART